MSPLPGADPLGSCLGAVSSLPIDGGQKSQDAGVVGACVAEASGCRAGCCAQYLQCWRACCRRVNTLLPAPRRHRCKYCATAPGDALFVAVAPRGRDGAVSAAASAPVSGRVSAGRLPAETDSTAALRIAWRGKNAWRCKCPRSVSGLPLFSIRMLNGVCQRSSRKPGRIHDERGSCGSGVVPNHPVMEYNVAIAVQRLHAVFS